jgi:hypothetical protein
MHNNSASISGGVVYLNTLNNGFSVIGCDMRGNFAAFNGSALYLQLSNDDERNETPFLQPAILHHLSSNSMIKKNQFSTA